MTHILWVIILFKNQAISPSIGLRTDVDKVQFSRFRPPDGHGPLFPESCDVIYIGPYWSSHRFLWTKWTFDLVTRFFHSLRLIVIAFECTLKNENSLDSNSDRVDFGQKTGNLIGIDRIPCIRAGLQNGPLEKNNKWSILKSVYISCHAWHSHFGPFWSSPRKINWLWRRVLKSPSQGKCFIRESFSTTLI